MEELTLSEIKLALKKEKLNFKTELNGTKDSITFIDEFSKVKLRGKIIRSFNEGEVHHWPLLNHENVAKLIDVLCIREDAYIYLTVDHEMTLKNIVHDENFVYNSRCFDRKRSYAKGIFSGLSYLHGKSLTLMNLCDDNIFISTTDDRAIITNFENLTISRKAEKSRLQVPEMYLAPETEKGEFDASKAEMWASGMLMLDMFLAHMVPWAIIDYKAKKVMLIVDKISLDLLQAANAGSIVSATDLFRFRTFLKCFFKKNPQERIPAKYASIASFLQRRDKYVTFGDSYESIAYSENENYSSLSKPDESMTVCLNPTYDPSSYFISSVTQKPETSSTNYTNPCVSKAEIKKCTEFGKNKMEFDPLLSETSTQSSKAENEKINSSKNLKKVVTPRTNVEVNEDFKIISKSLESFKESAKLKYNCYQTKSLTFIKPEGNYSNTTTFEENSCALHNESPVKQPDLNEFKSSDFGLNLLFDINIDETKNSSNNNFGSNTVIQCNCLNAVTSDSLSEIMKKWHVEIESHTKQRSPFSHEYNTSSLIPTKNIANRSRNLKALALSHKPESVSIVRKLLYLRKCFYSIQTHQKVYISKGFQCKQRKIIKEYQSLLLDEYAQLHQILRKIFCENEQNMIFQTWKKKQAIDGNIDNFKFHPNGKNIVTVKRKDSYYRAIENEEKNKYRNREIINQVNDKKLKYYDSNYGRKSGNSTIDIKCDKETKKECADGKKIEMIMQQYEQWKRNAKSVKDINCNSIAYPKELGHDRTAKIETAKQREQYKLKQIKRYDSFENVNNKNGARPKSAKKKKEKEMSAKTKPERKQKNQEREDKMKLNKCKQKTGKKTEKKEKNQDESKRSRFFTLCAGGSVD